MPLFLTPVRRLRAGPPGPTLPTADSWRQRAIAGLVRSYRDIAWVDRNRQGAPEWHL